MKKLLLVLFIFIFACSLILIASAKDVEQSSNEAASQMMLASPNDVEQSSNDEVPPIPYTLSPDPCSSEATNITPTPYPIHPTSLKEYIEEKIAPIIVGVVTSIIALLSTLKGIFSALKGLRESKATFESEQTKIRENSERELQKITEKYGEIKTELEGVYRLSPQLEAVDKRTLLLAQEIANLSKIVSIGFAGDKELIKDGKAREAVVLANKNGELIDNETI